MKVAIAKEGDEVSGHFGHCSEYALFTIEDSKIIQKEILKNPGHEPGLLPALLARHRVTHVLAGGMGPRAVDIFCASNIEVFLGIAGPIDAVLKDFIAGKVKPGQSSLPPLPGVRALTLPFPIPHERVKEASTLEGPARSFFPTSSGTRVFALLQ